MNNNKEDKLVQVLADRWITQDSGNLKYLKTYKK